MKAYLILDLVFKQDLRNDRCGVCHGSAVNECGSGNFFHARLVSGIFCDDADYFYFCCPEEDDLIFFPLWDVLLKDDSNGSVTCCWKIQN